MGESPASIAPASQARLPHTGQKPTHVRYLVMALLCALSFLTYFDRVCIMRAQNDISHDLQLNSNQMGIIFGAFWLAYALFEIPSGWLGDRFGTRAALTRIVAAWSLFTGLSGAAFGYYPLLACRFLFGAGEAGAYPNMAKVQRDWLPARSRARAGGLLWLLARWGGAFSPIIFGSLLRLFNSPAVHAVAGRTGLGAIAPWRMGFLLSGLVGVVWVAIFYHFFRDKPGQKTSVNEAELDLIFRDGDHDQDGPRAPLPSSVWANLFRSPSLWAMAILYLCGSFGWNFFVSWMPKFLKDVHGITFEKSELISGLPLFCGGIACLAGGMLSDVLARRMGRRVGRAILPIAGCLIAAIAIFCIRFAQSPTQAVILMCITAAAYDFGQAANWAALIDIGGRYAGVSTGFINMVGNLGNSLQGFIGALIFTHYGWSPLLALYAGAYVVAGSMWLIIDPTKKFHGEDPANFPQPPSI